MGHPIHGSWNIPPRCGSATHDVFMFQWLCSLWEISIVRCIAFCRLFVMVLFSSCKVVLGLWPERVSRKILTYWVWIVESFLNCLLNLGSCQVIFQNWSISWVSVCLPVSVYGPVGSSFSHVSSWGPVIFTVSVIVFHFIFWMLFLFPWAPHAMPLPLPLARRVRLVYVL